MRLFGSLNLRSTIVLLRLCTPRISCAVDRDPNGLRAMWQRPPALRRPPLRENEA